MECEWEWDELKEMCTLSPKYDPPPLFSRAPVKAMAAEVDDQLTECVIGHNNPIRRM